MKNIRSRAFAEARILVRNKILEIKELSEELLTEEQSNMIESIMENKTSHIQELAEKRYDFLLEKMNKAFAKKFEDKKEKIEIKNPTAGKKPNLVSHSKFCEEVEKNSNIFNALIKKAEDNELNLIALGEVYDRGYTAYPEGSRVTREQYAFARVNSFINQGKTYFNEDSDLVEYAQLEESNNKPYVRECDSGGGKIWQASNKHGKVKWFGIDFKSAAHKHAGIEESLDEDTRASRVNSPSFRGAQANTRKIADGSFKAEKEKEAQKAKSNKTYNQTVKGWQSEHKAKAKEHLALHKKYKEEHDEIYNHAAKDLYDKNHKGTITPTEHGELEEYDHILNGLSDKMVHHFNKHDYHKSMTEEVEVENNTVFLEEFKKGQKVFITKKHEKIGHNTPTSGMIHAIDDTHATIKTLGGSGYYKANIKNLSKNYKDNWLSNENSKLDEGKMKELESDLRGMDNGNFKKKYEKDKGHFKKPLNFSDKKVNEQVKTADKYPVVIPTHTDGNGNVIPAQTVMRKKGTVIIKSGNTTDGKNDSRLNDPKQPNQIR